MHGGCQCSSQHLRLSVAVLCVCVALYVCADAQKENLALHYAVTAGASTSVRQLAPYTTNIDARNEVSVPMLRFCSPCRA